MKAEPDAVRGFSRISPGARAVLTRTLTRLECEHIAALLKSVAEVPPVVASFLEVGAARNGWLVHGSLPGQADADRALLAAAGLDVVGLTARGQLEIMELDLTVAPADWVQPWSVLLDERLEAGFDALWFARFPIGPDESEIAAVLPFEDAWMRCFQGRRVVTLCPYIVGGIDAQRATSQLPHVASFHDRVVDLAGGAPSSD
ncbi:MAG: MEDS domain-containing protein [Chloroflexota bacterium]|nr:MEDS domain-containing protein [Chloroflexota bacterium]